MFRRNFLYLFVTAFLLLCLAAVVAVAQTAATAAAAPAADFDVKSLPAWLQWILGLFGVGALGIWGTMKAKYTKFIKLFEVGKLFITATLNMVTVVKKVIETATPEVKEAWYCWLNSMGNVLIETGNASLVQKGQLLISHVPADYLINKNRT